MNRYNLFGYEVEIDKKSTKKWYANADEWSCQCADCKHFVALAKKRELPSAIIEVLESFGIVPEKATYVCEIMTEGNVSLYQFSYRIAGNIIKDPLNDKKDLGWGEARCCHESYPYGALGFPEPHFDLELWVLLNDDFESDNDIPKVKEQNRILQLNLSKIAIIAQVAFLNVAMQPFEVAQTPFMQTIEFLIKFVPLVASSIWMAFNLKYEKNELQFRKNVKIESAYCMIQVGVFLFGYFSKLYWIGTLFLIIIALVYILCVNPKYMNRRMTK